MKRISLELVPYVGEPKIIIEHFLPRNGKNAIPELQLVYSNLFRVCRGNKDGPKLEKTYGQSKKHQQLKVVNLRTPRY